MQHSDLASGRWFALSVEEQIANIGSEIERAMKWKQNGNIKFANMANVRALELFDLTLCDPKHTSALKEVCRLRELWLDYFIGNNQYQQSADNWHAYVLNYTQAAQNIRKRG